MRNCVIIKMVNNMKKNGFTLVELIGTIDILSIIVLIALPATISMLSDGQSKVDDSLIGLVESAANQYVQEHLSDFPKQLETVSGVRNNGTITVTDLKDGGYLSTSVYEKNCHIKNDRINVTSNSKKYFYEYVEIEDSEAC